MKFKDLSPLEAKQVEDIVKKHIPWQNFKFKNGYVFREGVGGSRAEFIEISNEILFDMVTELVFNK